MKNIETEKTLLQMKKMIACLRLELEVLAEKVDKSLKKHTRTQKRLQK